jgi:hypothetical protein
MEVLQTTAFPLRHLAMRHTVALFSLFIKSVHLVNVDSIIYIHLYHMAKKRTWTEEQLKAAVAKSTSIRGVLIELGLIPAGGNYQHVSQSIKKLGFDSSHFKGMGWRRGEKYDFVPKKSLDSILKRDSDFQSFKLKKRLFRAGLKTPKCEICDWAEISKDGRIPVELDHINGDHRDNRLENLRILLSELPQSSTNTSRS